MVVLKTVLDLMNTLDCKKIELDASEIPTIQLYEKFGFREDYEKYILKKE